MKSIRLSWLIEAIKIEIGVLSRDEKEQRRRRSEDFMNGRKRVRMIVWYKPLEKYQPVLRITVLKNSKLTGSRMPGKRPHLHAAFLEVVYLPI